jgi:hypothetical protein
MIQEKTVVEKNVTAAVNDNLMPEASGVNRIKTTTRQNLEVLVKSDIGATVQ